MIVKQFKKKRKNEQTEDGNRVFDRNSSHQIKKNKTKENKNVLENSRNFKEFKLNKSKVRKRAIAFSRLKKSRKNLYFYTITFTEKLEDNLCFDCLNIALTRLRKDNLIEDYLWITERQKNTTLHFHLLTNDLFSVKILNNYIKSSLIYKHNRKEFQYDRSKIENYNGVDIAKNRNTRKVINLALQKDNRLIISYLTKYITKNNEKFSRLPFHSSHSISKLTHKYLIDQFEAQMIWDNHQASNQNPKKFQIDFCTLIFFSNDVSEEVFKPIDEENEKLYVLRKYGIV